MNYLCCSCITQPLYSFSRWMIRKGSTSINAHQKIVGQCEEEKLESLANQQKNNKQNKVSRIEPKKKIVSPNKLDIPLPSPKARTPPTVEESFEDELFLKSEQQQIQEKKCSNEVSHVTSFRVEKEQLGEYYELFLAKTSNFDQKFILKGTQLQLDQSPGNLLVSFIESQNLNIFMYEFTLPCSFAYYSNMLSDYDLQKSLDPNIDQYKLQQQISPNAKINYVGYKKILIVSPRDFVSLKYSPQCGQDHWQVSISIPSPIVSNKIRGQIILNAVRMRQTQQKTLDIKVYSQINMKLSVRPKLTRNQSLTQIRKYVQRCLKHIQDNPQKK